MLNIRKSEENVPGEKPFAQKLILLICIVKFLFIGFEITRITTVDEATLTCKIIALQGCPFLLV